MGCEHATGKSTFSIVCDSRQSTSQWNSSRRAPASSRTTWRMELARPTGRSKTTSARSGPVARHLARRGRRAVLHRLEVERIDVPGVERDRMGRRRPGAGSPGAASASRPGPDPTSERTSPSRPSSARRAPFSSTTPSADSVADTEPGAAPTDPKPYAGASTHARSPSGSAATSARANPIVLNGVRLPRAAQRGQRVGGDRVGARPLRRRGRGRRPRRRARCSSRAGCRGTGSGAGAATARRVAPRGARHPGGRLAELWQLLLLNQFHDILPGRCSSTVPPRATTPRGRAPTRSPPTRWPRWAARGAPFNTIGLPRAEVAADPDGDLAWVEARARGFGSVGAAPGSVSATESAEGVVLENGACVRSSGATGWCALLVEVGSGREALAAPGNLFQVYDDHPTAFDAWDVDPFHLETGEGLPAGHVVRGGGDGPLRAEVVFRAAGRPGRGGSRWSNWPLGTRARVPLRGSSWHERTRS